MKEKGGKNAKGNKNRGSEIALFTRVYRVKSYQSYHGRISILTLFLSYKVLYIINKVKPSTRNQGAKKFAPDVSNYATFSWGKVHPVLFLRPALRLANWCFTGNSSWFIAGIFLQSTCRPRAQQLTRVYATRIELQCFSVTIVRVATWCTPRATHMPFCFPAHPLILLYTYYEIIGTVFIHQS